MTTNPSLFIPVGARVQLPSGGRAVLARWVSRHINPQNRDDGMERVALVQLEGGAGSTEFSEAFMRRCQVLS